MAVLLFYDHDWKTPLLEQALAQAAFFVGAMGSQATHRARLEELRRNGIEEERLAHIAGPIGLLPATRDPDMLAFSVLAHVVSRHRTTRAAELLHVIEAVW